MKLLVGLNNKNLDDYLNYTNSFIIGLKEFSINYMEMSIEEIKDILDKYSNIEVFIAINKNIFNKDLKELKEKLLEIDKLAIKGVLFYDLAILKLHNDLKLHFDLVWHQEHMVTNYNTCNYYYSKGVNYAYTSSEITCEEIREIHDKSNIKLMSLLFGYPKVSFSKRKLLTNYFKYYDLEKDKDNYVITNAQDEKYLISESNEGTSILYGNLLNGIKPMHDLCDVITYGVLSEEMVSHELFMEALKIFSKVNNGEIDYLTGLEELFKLTNSEDTVFYYKKTIYKVKDENKN